MDLFLSLQKKQLFFENFVNCKSKFSLFLRMEQITPYKPKYKVRIVTAASLFDGHDATINIIEGLFRLLGSHSLGSRPQC